MGKLAAAFAVTALASCAGDPTPPARCMAAAPGRILSSAGTFDARADGRFEVVADTATRPGFPRYGDPAIHVFAPGCRLVWQRSYPDDWFAEVGFRTLHWPGGRLLQVSAASSPDEPADQVITAESILAARHGVLVELAAFGRDRHDWSHVGRLGPGGGYGVVAVSPAVTIPPGWTGRSSPWSAQLWRWTPARSARPGTLVGPTALSEAELTAMHLSKGPTEPPFPLEVREYGPDAPGS